MRWPILAFFAAALLWGGESHAQQVVGPRAVNGSYVIGPYPVPLEAEGVTATLYVSLVFTLEHRPRDERPFKLYLQAWAELTHLAPAIKQAAIAQTRQDNCVRINNVDNWVHHVGDPSLTVIDKNRLRVKLRVDASTWTCTEGVPELVCEGFHCKLRPTKIKIKNFEQGGVVRKDYWIDVKSDQILYRDFEPEVDLDNNTVLQNLLNDGMKVALKLDDPVERNKMLPVSAIEIATPADFKAFDPRLESGGFVTHKDRPFLTFTYSVSISRTQINDFMSKYFGSLYTPHGPSRSDPPPPSAPLTKASVRAECASYMAANPGASYQQCAAMMGLPYDELPD